MTNDTGTYAAYRCERNHSPYNSVSERRIRNNRRMRNLQLQRHMRISLLTIFLVLSCSGLFFGFKSRAQSGDEPVRCKYYKSVMVHSGDTIWEYAELYADSEFYDSHQSYIHEVMNMNGLSDDRLTAGQYILIPYYGDAGL